MNKFFELAKKLIKKIVILFINVDNRKVIIIDETPYSGSNAGAFYSYLKENTNLYDVFIYTRKELEYKSNFIDRVKVFKELHSAKIVVCTHEFIKRRSEQFVINLWHGIPMKRMGLLDNKLESTKKQAVNASFNKYDCIISSSPFNITIMNACIGVTNSKYSILGQPRNDLLFLGGHKEKLSTILNKSIKNEKVIFFLPTFRSGYQERVEGITKDKNIFGFNDIDYVALKSFLKNNNIILVCKLHPFEEKIFNSQIKQHFGENLYLLTTEMLNSHKIDLYEVLNAADILLTDYSSVYFDFLLTNKPILFIQTDIELYRENRGFLLEPYDFWTPGPKIRNQEELKNEIISYLHNIDSYKDMRNTIKDIFHTYTDDKSSERVFNYILKQLKAENKIN